MARIDPFIIKGLKLPPLSLVTVLWHPAIHYDVVCHLFLFSFQEAYFAIGADVLSPRRIGSPLAENIELGAQCFTTMQTPSGNFLVSCGNWENSFQLIALNDGRLVQSVRRHKDVVSCVYGIYFLM